jgi:hypothetical protein
VDLADTRQEGRDGLTDALRADTPGLAGLVALDVGRGTDARDLEPAVTLLLEAIARGPRPQASTIAALRAEGAAAAREGRPLAEPIDVYLSSAWVVWDRAVELAALNAAGDPAGDLAALGRALLRAGDDIAAALADGYTSAERALAARVGATRRAVLAELLAPHPADPGGQARLARRAELVGLDPVLPIGLIVVRGTAELEGDGPVTDAVSRQLARDPARRPSLVGVRDTDLVVLLAGPWRSPDIPVRALDDAPRDDPWWAVSVDPVPLAALPDAHADALDSLRILPGCRPPHSITRAGDVALERALVADATLAEQAVARWLGPLAVARRGADLVATLEAWLAEGQSVVGAARVLGVAARTVSYRLVRVARLLGVRELDAATRERLVTALLMRRLLHAGSSWRSRDGE